VNNTKTTVLNGVTISLGDVVIIEETRAERYIRYGEAKQAASYAEVTRVNKASVQVRVIGTPGSRIKADTYELAYFPSTIKHQFTLKGLAPEDWEARMEATVEQLKEEAFRAKIKAKRDKYVHKIKDAQQKALGEVREYPTAPYLVNKLREKVEVQLPARISETEQVIESKKELIAQLMAKIPEEQKRYEEAKAGEIASPAHAFCIVEQGHYCNNGKTGCGIVFNPRKFPRSEKGEFMCPKCGNTNICPANKCQRITAQRIYGKNYIFSQEGVMVPEDATNDYTADKETY